MLFIASVRIKRRRPSSCWVNYPVGKASHLADVTDCTEMPVMLSDHAGLYSCSLKQELPSLKIAHSPSAHPQHAATAKYAAQLSVPIHFQKSSITDSSSDMREDQPPTSNVQLKFKTWQLPQTSMMGLTASIYILNSLRHRAIKEQPSNTNLFLKDHISLM